MFADSPPSYCFGGNVSIAPQNNILECISYCSGIGEGEKVVFDLEMKNLWKF